MPRQRSHSLLPIFVIFLSFAGLHACAPADSGGQASADANALKAESLMVDALGGRSAWESARFFDFVWAIDRGEGEPYERHHLWDRWTGQYRLEMPWGEGQELLAIFNGNSKEGNVWIDGVHQRGDTVDYLLDRAHGAYINDTYWFIMPFKWRDPGVNLSYIGRAEDWSGKEWETVGLTFEGVGRTPNNRYRVYIDPESHLIGWWEHFRNREDTTTNTRTLWLEWERRGPVMVSLDRPFITPDGERTDRRIYFPRAVVSATVDEGAFAPPDPS